MIGSLGVVVVVVVSRSQNSSKRSTSDPPIQDVDRAPVASPARQSPFMGGKVAGDGEVELYIIYLTRVFGG